LRPQVFKCFVYANSRDRVSGDEFAAASRPISPAEKFPPLIRQVM
jgi:hypothetical protein